MRRRLLVSALVVSLLTVVVLGLPLVLVAVLADELLDAGSEDNTDVPALPLHEAAPPVAPATPDAPVDAAEPISLDPALINDVESSQVVRLLFELRAREMYDEIQMLSEPRALNIFRERVQTC